jgi:cellulose synthase/poly-beta-1,6-N-acetylglucosamine synthase-like glycosyltransferase
MQFSVLIAARNEEHQIEKCLQALSATLKNFGGSAEILVGDDSSEDDTLYICQKFSEKNGDFSVFAVPSSELRGKANVLAFLAKKAKGEYLLFVDADTRVNPDWLVTCVKYAHYDLFTGVSLPAGESFFSSIQAFEWALMLLLMHFFSKRKTGITCMGNNMGIKKSMYEKTGGYEKIPFSVTEDYALFRAVLAENGSFINLFEKGILAETESVRRVSDWFSQRKRWLRGAWEGGNSVFFGTFFFCNFFIFASFLLFYSAALFFTVFLSSSILLFFAAKYINFRLSKKILRAETAIFYPFYHIFFYPKLFFITLFFKQIHWKNRIH